VTGFLATHWITQWVGWNVKTQPNGWVGMQKPNPWGPTERPSCNPLYTLNINDDYIEDQWRRHIQSVDQSSIGPLYGGIAFRLCGRHLPISRDLMSSILQNSIHYSRKSRFSVCKTLATTRQNDSTLQHPEPDTPFFIEIQYAMPKHLRRHIYHLNIPIRQLWGIMTCIFVTFALILQWK
jgi:hypothetical protein